MLNRTLSALCSAGLAAAALAPQAVGESPRPAAPRPTVGGPLLVETIGSEAAPRSPTGPAAEADRRRHPPGTLEVQFTDGSVLYLKLRDAKLELATRYGSLQIPVTDVEGVELGLRIPDEVAKRIESAIAALGSNNFRTREAASTTLLELKEKAYPALVKASHDADAEVAHRAEELVNQLRETVPEDRLSARDYDVVRTKDSVIAGKIAGSTLKVSTAQFGEQQIRLADVARIGPPAAPAGGTDNASVATDPGNLTPFQAHVGQTLAFRVTGAVGGALWGTDLYTLDSSLATAAVHAGLLAPGQTGVLKVTILGPQVAFQGSARNGVTSAPYANYPAAFRLSKDRRP